METYGTATDITVSVHKKCISSYTSKTHITRDKDKKRKSGETGNSMDGEGKKRSRKENQFDFRKHCLFCPDIKECLLPSEYVKKVPLDRRVAAYNVRTVVMNCLQGENGEVLKKKGKKYKDHIIQICDSRNDSLGEIVRARVLSALSDLHAAGAKYHNHCSIKFLSIQDISHNSAGSSKEERDHAFFYVVNQMIENKTKCWSSIELFSMYKELGGLQQSRKIIFGKILQFLGEEVIQLSSPGKANLIVFRAEAAKHFHLQDDGDDDVGISSKGCQ